MLGFLTLALTLALSSQVKSSQVESSQSSQVSPYERHLCLHPAPSSSQPRMPTQSSKAQSRVFSDLATDIPRRRSP